MGRAKFCIATYQIWRKDVAKTKSFFALQNTLDPMGPFSFFNPDVLQGCSKDGELPCFAKHPGSYGTLFLFFCSFSSQP